MAKKIILGIFAFFGLVLILYLGFLYFSYIDESISAGNGYGLKIGMSKKETYENILKKYGKTIKRYAIYKRRYYDQKLEYIHRYSFSLSKFSYDDLAQYSGWEFYFHKIYWDYLFMEFKEGKLITIHRHRQYYELP